MSLVHRLRNEAASCYVSGTDAGALLGQAAVRIEWLEAALVRIGLLNGLRANFDIDIDRIIREYAQQKD